MTNGRQFLTRNVFSMLWSRPRKNSTFQAQVVAQEMTHPSLSPQANIFQQISSLRPPRIHSYIDEDDNYYIIISIKITSLYTIYIHISIQYLITYYNIFLLPNSYTATYYHFSASFTTFAWKRKYADMWKAVWNWIYIGTCDCPKLYCSINTYNRSECPIDTELRISGSFDSKKFRINLNVYTLKLFVAIRRLRK